MCHGEGGPCVLRKLKSTHRPPQKHATPISQPVWLGHRIEVPSGVVEIQAHSWGTLGKVSTYISSHKHMHVHTRPFRHVVCSLSLQAGISPLKFTKDMKKTPSQHAVTCNGNGGYPFPTRAHIATRDKYPGGGDGKIRNAIAFEYPTHSQSDGAKAPIAIHIRILVRRGRTLPLGLRPRRM